ncbi:MAG: Gfo/Idh/MocA family oxidoreductase [Deltaproteobacteria bacterium]|nr:Gfo/Idh/MocA family oxidoreductase [Deltaproteobacteria bacterium]
MPERRLRIGIIGFGRIALAHANAAMDLKDLVELVAISTRRDDRAREGTERFGVKRVYSDYRRLLEDQEIEAVLVCLPNHMHHPVCLEAARAGKHILVEKPMALNFREADEMVEEARTNGVTLMVGQSRRFSDAMAEIRARMDEIGHPFRIDINFLVSFPQPPTDWWRSSQEAGGLVILLQGSHSVDTILWLLDKTPSTVFALSRSRNPLWEGEDEADMILGFDSGEMASVHLSLNTTPYLHETIIVGPRGTMRLFEFPAGGVFGFSYRLEINGETVMSGQQAPSLYTVQLKEFSEAIRDKRSPVASGDEVRRTMFVLDGIRRSDREGIVIRLNPPQT